MVLQCATALDGKMSRGGSPMIATSCPASASRRVIAGTEIERRTSGAPVSSVIVPAGATQVGV